MAGSRDHLVRSGVRSTIALAWSLCALCLVLAVSAPLLGFLNGRSVVEVVADEGIVAISALIASYSVVGALVASRRPENPIGWVFCAAALFQSLSVSGYEYATYALLTEPGSLPLGAEASWLAQWIWAPGLALILVFLPLLFPDGRPPSRRWWWVAWFGGLSIGLIFVMAVILLWPERGAALLGPEGPAEEGTSHAMFVVVMFAAFPMMVMAGLSAVVSLFFRFRRARGDERQQTKWFVSASALTLAFAFAWNFSLDAESASLKAGFALSSVIFAPAIPVATGVAILRYRLYDIDVVINRTLVYGTLTVLLTLAYFGGVAGLQYLFRVLTGQEHQSQLAVIASTLAIAALFVPVRRRVQAFIDRRFYRRKYNAAKTLKAFTAKLHEETDLDALNGEMVSVVQKTMQPAYVSLWLRFYEERRPG
jgi:hypothetical protein